ncbi:MAG: bifunctional adenosylcobinamide kinase/adenosylcobinamide-phosphate guanylyltransferase [Acetatifactor sp.]|nr:bifunctional adenosylcobinamide kinase/adenosylcobinamide-phosphate guanylyltransferase [Acetatifactor sp.]
MLILVSGGSGSGKSEYAEKVACRFFQDRGGKAGKLYYIATMVSFDAETDRRIARHRALRDGKGFYTIECPTHLEKVECQGGDVLLLECMSNLLANEMFGEDGRLRETEETEVSVITDAVDAMNSRVETFVIVTNEIFSDGKKYDETTERYRKRLGIINQKLAEMAGVVVEVVCGIPVSVKGELPC